MLSSLDNEQFRKTLLSWPEKAMVLLYQDHYESLMRIADMHTRDRHASEDVLQEVFADIWQKRREIGQQRDEPVHGYLIRAVQYHAISLYKKKQKPSMRRRTITTRKQRARWKIPLKPSSYPGRSNASSD